MDFAGFKVATDGDLEVFGKIMRRAKAPDINNTNVL
jgi:hypothetical protein